MNHSGPRISALRTWQRWETFFFAALNRALEMLRVIENLPESENELNSRLLDCLRLAARELRPKGNYPPIRAECPPLPYGQAEETVRRLKPTPDFLWGYIDRTAPALYDVMDFTIECKRLRHASRSWNYNESYVRDGIQRFISEEKRYAIGVPSAVMVGYWQSMEADDVLADVNKAVVDRAIPLLILSSGGWKLAGISTLDHRLIRSFPVSPCHLRHLWIDLRRTRTAADNPE
jgi:hypothetical protein